MAMKLGDDRGQAALEIGVIVGLIAMVALGVLIYLGNGTTRSLQTSANAVTTANQPYSPTQ